MLTIPGAEDLRLPIVEHIYPPYMITECPTSPLDAPVKAAAIEGLLGAFSQIWSYDFLTALIRSQEWENPFVSLAARECRDHTVVGKEAVLGCLTATATARFSPFRVDALNSLQFLGSAARPAVPELIPLLEAMDDPSPQYLFFPGDDIPGKVAETLKVITGQDFGTDAAQWLEWWESQP